jgi:hypothetical protein
MKKLAVVFIAGCLVFLTASAAWAPCGLSGYVFCDVNQNGEIDEGDTPFSGVGILIDGVQPATPTFTDANGFYYVLEDYYVCKAETVSLDLATLPADVTFINTLTNEVDYTRQTNFEQYWLVDSATCREEVVGACRMTGGNATVSPFIGTDGLETWTYDFKSLGSDFYITTGGQIGAPSGGEPRGHWTHTQHGGAEGNFTFHSGTSSAPDGTEISTIECADPGWCVQARCAPFKQIFWTGVGNFASQHFDAVFSPGTVVPFGGKNKVGTRHFYRAMVGDFGENDRPTREESLVDNDPDTCNWFDLLPGGPPGPYDASSAIFLDSEPDDQFGDKGGQVCDKCPDYYQIEIHSNESPESPVIYEFYGYLESGNYQIHPKTGEQCPATLELVPELFETSKGKGRNK